MAVSFMLSVFSLAMFFGSYLSGLVPLAFNLSETKMRYVTVLGAGLLVGTALAVIIPEGVHALYINELESAHGKIESDHKIIRRDLSQVNIGDKSDKAKNLNIALEHKDLSKSSSTHEHSNSTHSAIGITLVLGFVFMLIVDNASAKIFRQHASQVIDSSGAVIITKPKATWTATLGLVVHAAADGIALGAASATSRFDVELIVFMAIILHKAPAAFGLVSFLISDGVDRKRIRRHLLIFSLAAPLMAIFTFVLLKSGIRDAYSVDSTGIAMLFSAGTFLFVATVHVLPEVQSHYDDKQFSPMELLTLIIGCCFPIVLSMGHKH
ncbi:unnamed protein product [Rotaria magnacalcarata]|uniref:Solute carrier family 39 member 9 n=2 Tax=Rotaria magnacalcarata TaxID=392030 RepID=A0A815AYM9_9BILA|nr:unnamed protein product [Rotaria magnacalcarata]CAF1936462.1 unnamed protein product [Rotaria magnacalcarata]CAF2055424.1 unnamed protein product [Rotaria magnacalcarata]CAF2066853.1 unnamed protein product [Rotaria magnacalcarata]CAF3889994.1 unnamed protein product [Rotaria magnacalcarata]